MYAIQTDENGYIIAWDKGGIVYNPERDFLFAKLPEGVTEENIFEYAYRNGKWVHDIRPVEFVEPEETIESLKEKLDTLQEQNDMLLECIMEMSEIIYA